MCCRFWGISPAEFERQAAAHEFTWADVYELIRQLSNDPVHGTGTLQYIWGEKIAELQRIENENASLDILWERALRSRSGE